MGAVAYILHKRRKNQISALFSDTLFSLTYCYQEQVFEDNLSINNCADLTAIRLQDGTLIDNFPYAVDGTVTENQQTFFTQSASLDQLQDYSPSLSQKTYSMEDIEAVYIAEWDPQEKTFDYANFNKTNANPANSTDNTKNLSTIFVSGHPNSSK